MRLRNTGLSDLSMPDMISAEKNQKRKEVNSMNYAKPKIVSCGAAQSLIQGSKALTGAFDAIQSTPEHRVYNMTPLAYEADE